MGKVIARVVLLIGVFLWLVLTFALWRAAADSNARSAELDAALGTCLGVLDAFKKSPPGP